MLYMTELLLLYALIIRLRDMTRLRYLLGEEVLFPPLSQRACVQAAAYQALAAAPG